MSRITIIGGGHVGTTLGILCARQGHEIVDVVCRTEESAEKSCRLIGKGMPCISGELLSPADIYIIAISDNALSSIAGQLLQVLPRAFKVPAIVFHCSGTTPAEALAPLRESGVAIASVHPVKTFTDAVRDADSFPGTCCGIEGDAAAIAVLEPLFQVLGAKTFPIDGTRKTLYHAAIVFMSNYLTPLIEIGQQCYEAAGVPRDLSAQIAAPILHATVDNALRLGPAEALTGPIARGDDAVVRQQIEALSAFDPAFADLYKKLGMVALDLSAQKGAASAESLAVIRRLLEAA